MTKLAYTISAGIATVAMLATSVAPAFAAGNYDISGNLKKSVNTINSTSANSSVVGQGSNTFLGNLVLVGQNTGKNKANDNGGGAGDPSIHSGDATIVSNVGVTGGSNTYNQPNQCGCESTTNAQIKNNGKKSVNTINLLNSNSSVVEQSSNTMVYNGVIVGQNTGHNQANDNVGGPVTITSGDATVVSNVGVTGGSNSIN